MAETITAPCLACGTKQSLALCLDCRPRYPFMRDWPFERIVRYFMEVVFVP